MGGIKTSHALSLTTALTGRLTLMYDAGAFDLSEGWLWTGEWIFSHSFSDRLVGKVGYKLADQLTTNDRRKFEWVPEIGISYSF